MPLMVYPKVLFPPNFNSRRALNLSRCSQRHGRLSVLCPVRCNALTCIIGCEHAVREMRCAFSRVLLEVFPPLIRVCNLGPLKGTDMYYWMQSTVRELKCAPSKVLLDFLPTSEPAISACNHELFAIPTRYSP